LPSCQLHISVNRTAQIYLELHFCVELHTKKSPDKLQYVCLNVPPQSLCLNLTAVLYIIPEYIHTIRQTNKYHI